MVTRPHMIYELPRASFDVAASLYAGRWFDEAFIDSMFEGTQDGLLFVDDPRQPQAALLCRTYEYYIAGDPSNRALRQFIADAPAEAGVFADLYGYCALSPAWDDALLSDHGDRLVIIGRRSFKFQGERARLLDWRAMLPEGMRIVPIDRTLIGRIDTLLAPIPGVGSFMGGTGPFFERGFGVCAMQGETVASVAHTGSVSSRYADIDINTAAPFRGQGLATLAAAACVEECIARGLIPTWHTDATNVASMATARKIGYEEGAPFSQLSPPEGTRLRLSEGRWAATPLDAGAPDRITIWRPVAG
jgi:hypothetical protein